MRGSALRRLRSWHQYMALFFAPMILLFALSGALQTFRLQEEKGYGGTPPTWIVWMASVHKDSATPRDRGAERKEQRPVARVAERARPIAKPAPASSRPSRLPMQVFVALLSVGLIVSSVLGVMIALNNAATRRVSILMLVIGTVLPLLLML